MQVELNGRTIDLTKAVPLVMKDWRLLQRTKQINWGRLSTISSDPEAAHGYIAYVLRKADPTVTDEEIDQLTDTQMLAALEAIRQAHEAAGVLIPFLTPSMPSVKPTDGLPGTSGS